MSDSLWPHGLQHTRLPCPSPTPGVCSNSCPSWVGWSHSTIFSSALLTKIAVDYSWWFWWFSQTQELVGCSVLGPSTSSGVTRNKNTPQPRSTRKAIKQGGCPVEIRVQERERQVYQDSGKYIENKGSQVSYSLEEVTNKKRKMQKEICDTGLEMLV